MSNNATIQREEVRTALGETSRLFDQSMIAQIVDHWDLFDLGFPAKSFQPLNDSADNISITSS